MISKKKYSIRKVSVGTASVLIGITAGSLGTAYAQEEINNVVVSAEVNRNVSEKPLDKPILEESMKPSFSPEVTSKPTRADSPILTPAPVRPSSPVPTTALEIKSMPSPEVSEDNIDWTLIKEKEYLKYSLDNIIDGTEKERLVNSLWAVKSTEDLLKIRNEYEVIKKAEEKQKELENRVYSLKRVHNLYLSDDQNQEFTKEVASAKNGYELDEIINKYKLEESKRNLSRDYNYSSIPREEIKAANSIVELNSLKEKYRLSDLKGRLVSSLERTSEVRRDENTGAGLPLLSENRRKFLLKEIEALKTSEKAEELRKIISAEQQIIYRREEVISSVKHHLTDLTDEQLVPFVNELEKYITEADLNKVKEKIVAEDKKLREERIKKEQTNILEVLNTKAKLNDYEKEKLKQEMVEQYKREYEEYRGPGIGIVGREWTRLKYNYVGKSNSEFNLLSMIERIESLRNDEYLSDEVKRKYIDQILQKNENRNIYELINVEKFIGNVNKSELLVEDKNILKSKAEIILSSIENGKYIDRDAMSNLYSIFNNIKNIESISEIPTHIKQLMKDYLFRDEVGKSLMFEPRDYKSYYSLKNKIFSLIAVPKELTFELKRLLEIVEKEEIKPITNRLSGNIDKDGNNPKIAIPGETKLSQLTTKVESLEKLYSYTRIPEYKLIKFRDEMLDATSSENVRNTLATARAVDETLEILGFNGDYPKVKDRLADKVENKTLKEDKEIKDSNKSDVSKENKVTEDNQPAKDTSKKETSKEVIVPKNKNEVSKKDTSDKKEESNNEKQEALTNNPVVENHVLSAKLSGKDVTVSFDKSKINADDVFVGAINDVNLNKAIIEKLGNEYKVIEVFEIHFKKDGKKIDSDAERTVKLSVVKNDNAELEVYHIADNNVLEKVDSSYSEGSLQFNINHFSSFAILERIRVGAKDLESRVQIATLAKADYKVENNRNILNTNNSLKDNKNNKTKITELPKTGLETTRELGIALLALGSAIAIRRGIKFLEQK